MIPAVINQAGMVPAQPPLMAEIAAMRRQLDALEARALAERVSGLHSGLLPRQWIDLLAGIVAEEFGITPGELMGSSRRPQYVRARFTWVWTVWKTGEYSLPRTAQATGYCDHTTVGWAIKRVEGWRAAQPDYRLVTDNLLAIGQGLRARRPPPAEEVAP
jgi:chromosomal replication initiation ATPase DnaA